MASGVSQGIFSARRASTSMLTARANHTQVEAPYLESTLSETKLLASQRRVTKPTCLGPVSVNGCVEAGSFSSTFLRRPHATNMRFAALDSGGRNSIFYRDSSPSTPSRHLAIFLGSVPEHFHFTLHNTTKALQRQRQPIQPQNVFRPYSSQSSSTCGSRAFSAA